VSTSKEAVHTDSAPAAVGPYSQAVKAGSMVICSGQIPIDPSNGELVTGDIQAQTHQVMKNLQAVLEASGSGFDRAVRFTIFLTDLGDFGKVNEVYASYLSEPYPARACVQVSALPKGVDVEIDAIALCD
jgi:2-iminobutanoate/2-iminopropanoate deaminase